MPEKSLQHIDEYFSDGFRRILIFANEIAKEKNALDIDTEHLLFGLLRNAEKDPILQRILKSYRVTREEIVEKVEKEMKQGKEAKDEEFLAFSARTKSVLLASDQERRALHHHSTSGEHLFIALSKGDGVASHVLKSMGITKENSVETITKVVGAGKEKDVLSSGNTPLLDEFGIDMCQMAREGKIDAVIGRAEEIERSIHILARRRKNNPLLIGEPGVGKTAIVEGLANRIVKGDVPEVLKGKRLISLALNTLIAGASKRGEFEKRLDGVIKEVIKSEGEIILFLDEIHTLVSSESAGDAAQILKPALARGEIHMIGATTLSEHHQYIESDAAFARRFQLVMVPEPSLEEACQILQGAKDKYEAFHTVKISDEIIETIVRLSDRFIPDRFLPDKAFDILDEAAAMARMPSISTPEKEKKITKELEQLKGELDRSKGVVSLDELTVLQKKIGEREKKLQDIHDQYEEEKSRSHDELQEKQILQVISRWSGTPMGHLGDSEAQQLLHLEDTLHERLIGQDFATKAVASAIRRGRSGIRKPKRPIGSFLFMGPSGVGKTECAKTLAEVLFGREDIFIRFDMSEFMEKHAVSRLTGPPPGYVGYEKGGELTEAVRKQPYSILLFDEIEKAHKDVFLLLLQILDDGRLTDNHGRTVTFKHTIIICTSNLSSEIITKNFEEYWEKRNQKDFEERKKQKYTELEERETREKKEIQEKGEQAIDATEDAEEKKEIQNLIDDRIKSLHHEIEKEKREWTEEESPMSADDFQKKTSAAVLPELLQFFRPEVLNRFDEQVFFSPLKKVDLIKIVDIMLRETREMLGEKGLKIRISNAAKIFLSDKGYEPAFGARPLRRAIQKYIEDPLSDKLIANFFDEGDTILIDVNGDQLSFEKSVSDGKNVVDPFDELEKQREEVIEEISSGEQEIATIEEKENSEEPAAPKGGANVLDSLSPANLIAENIAEEQARQIQSPEEEEEEEKTSEKKEENEEKKPKKSLLQNLFVHPKGEEAPSPPEEQKIRFVDGKIVEG